MPVDFLELKLEESPRYEGAGVLTPYRVSSDVAYLPIRSARLSPGVEHLDRSDELRGIEGSPARLIETFNPSASISERAYINHLTWLLEMSGFTGVFTAGNGVITDPDAVVIPAGASRWVFTKSSGITAQTGQLVAQYADEGVTLKGQGMSCSSLSLNANGELSADLMGLVLSRIATLGTTPAFDAASIVPARRADLFLTWLGSGGAVNDFSLAINNPLERVRSLSLATPSNFSDLMQYGDERVAVTGSIPKRVLNAVDYDALLAATTFAAKARWKTPKSIGATAYRYSLWVEMPACQYVSGDADELGNKRRFGMGSLDWFAAYDDTAGYDVKITLVNAVTATKTWV